MLRLVKKFWNWNRFVFISTTILTALFAINACGLANLSDDEEVVVDYLVKDWSARLHATSIPQAMVNLEMDVTDEARYNIWKYLSKHTDISRNLDWWGANYFVFTADEHRIGKFLLNHQRDNGQLPTLAAISAMAGVSEAECKNRLAFFARIGYMAADESTLGYAFVEGAETWAGPHRHNHHVITINDGKPFSVWCVADFLEIVMSDVFEGSTIRFEDMCGHCTETISLVLTDGKIQSLEPSTVWFQRGGGCAADNFFLSEEHIDEWIAANEDYANLTKLPLDKFLRRIASEVR